MRGPRTTPTKIAESSVPPLQMASLIMDKQKAIQALKTESAAAQEAAHKELSDSDEVSSTLQNVLCYANTART